MNKHTLENILQDLIAEETHLFFDKNKNVLTIEESENQDEKQLHSVTIKGITACYLAFKMDDNRYNFLGKLLNEVSDIRKAVDAIVICNIGGKDYVLLIEMKSQTIGKERQGIAKKLKNSQAFVSFLQIVLTNHYKLDKNISQFKVINILFDRKVNKGIVSTVTIANTNVSYKHRGFGRPDNEVRIRPFLH